MTSRLSIRAALFATVLTVAVPAASIVVFSGLGARRAALHDAMVETEHFADEIASRQVRLVAGTEQLLRTLAEIPQVRNREPGRVHALLAQLARVNPQYTNLVVADLHGQVWAQSSGAPPFAVGDRRYFREALATGRLAAGEYVVSRANGRPAFNVALTYAGPDGAVAGVIAAGIDVGSFRQDIDFGTLPEGASYMLLDRNGTVLTRAFAPERFVGKPYLPDRFAWIQAGPDRGAWTGSSLAGEGRHVAYRKLRLEDGAQPYVYVLAGIAVGPAVAGADHELFVNVALMAAVLLAALALAWVVGAYAIAAPLRALGRATRRVAEGDLTTRVADAVRGGELGRLAARFDEMAAELGRRREAEAEQQALREQLAHAQKMESVGRLAGGLAHDFNNLLCVINGHCDLVLDDPALTPARREDVSLIRQAGVSAATLTRQLLTFSRKRVHKQQVLELNAVVSNLDRMLHRLVGENVALTLRFDPEAWLVRADTGQIEQVVMNLVVNACDAMPGGGALVIETANTMLDESYTRNHRLVSPGQYVQLSVSDTGVGMDAATLARVFEPFFTTKGEGKGTGLGLSIVYGIAAQCGGHVTAYSEPGRGTTFKVYLPRALGQVDPARPAERAAAAVMPAATVLVAEDSDGVRSLVREVLTQRGHAVLEARSGEEAIELARNHAGSIDLLVTDVVMPGAGGRRAAEVLAEVRPGLPVLYVSGYTEDAILSQGLLEKDLDFLEKPFTTRDLVEKVTEILGRKPPAPPLTW